MTPQRPNVGDLQRPDLLEPDWIVGFVDGEGCFRIGINRNPALRFGYQILPEFVVVQHERDLPLLYRLRTAFGCGVVRKNHADRYCWRVRDLKQLEQKIIPFFEKHKLRSKKAVEFKRFARVVRKMVKGEHLTEEGFKQICRIASWMNRRAVSRVGSKRESMPE